MSQSELRSQALPAGGQPQGQSRASRGADLVATVQHLIFDPGLYTLHVGAPRVSNTDMGVKLPCVRLETIPPTQLRPGRAHVVNTRETGWLSPSAEPSFVLVTGGQAGAILTVYRANDGMPPPEVRFSHIFVGAGPRPEGVLPIPGAAATAETGVRLALLAHVSGVGDVSDPTGNWVGRPGSGMSIEGFSITPSGDFPADGLEYQAILGSNWNTPWFKGGEYCGSRGLMLPLLGYRAQIKGPAAEAFDIEYFGQFVGGKSVGPIRGGEACAAADTPLEAIRVVLTPKTAAATPERLVPDRSALAGPAPAAARKPEAPHAKKPAPAPEKPQAAKPAAKPAAPTKPRTAR